MAVLVRESDVSIGLPELGHVEDHLDFVYNRQKFLFSYHNAVQFHLADLDLLSTFAEFELS